MAIYDTMQYIKSPVSTLCFGQAASMGGSTADSGRSGKRFALPHSRIMLHQPMGGFQGQATDIDIHAREILRMREELDQILVNIGPAHGESSPDTERDYFMDGEQAREYGIIDKVIAKGDIPPTKESGG